MDGVPKNVVATFSKLRKEYSFYTTLKRINDKYYLYHQSTIWLKNAKKTKTVSEYLGRIRDDGAFIKKMHLAKSNLVDAESLITAHGGEVIWHGDTDKVAKPQTERHDLAFTEVENRLLTTLSMNARASLAFVGRQIGLTPSITYNHVKQLEKKCGIRYIAEINPEKLGYLRFFVMVKFRDRIPNELELKAVISKSPNVQLAMLTKGKYDLMIYVLATSNLDIMRVVIDMRMGLVDYPSEWYIVNFYEHFNFVPLRDEFIDVLKANLLNREYSVLKELNQSGNKDFVDIDRKYGFDEGRSSYTFYRLKEKGIIDRVTVTLSNTVVKYVGVIFLNIIDRKKFGKNREKLLSYTIREKDAPTMNYVLAGDDGNPDGILYFVPVLNEGDLEREAEGMEKLDLGAKFDTAIVLNTLLGSFCYRKFDYVYSKQHMRLVEDYGLPQKDQKNYEDTGRKSCHIATGKRRIGIRGEEIRIDN